MLKWIRKHYFNPEDPLEYHIFMIFFFECFLLSLVSGLLESTPMVAYGILGTVVEWGFIAACIVLLSVPAPIRVGMQKPMLIVITFIYLPFLYLQSAGHDGTMLWFSMLGIFMVSFIFTGKQLVVVVGLDIVLNMVLVWAGYHIDGLVVGYLDESARIWDIITSIPMCFIALGSMVVYVRRAYDNSNRKLVRLATKDALTGIYNRRSMQELLERKVGQAKQTKTSFIIMMLDIDHFKKLNDTYGHPFGDLVLQKFSETVQSVLRKEDLFARYGGEEFVVMLHLAQLDKGVEVGERIRQAVKAMAFDNGVQVKVSIGMTAFTQDDTITKLLSRADENLYQAKQAGRDRVVQDLEQTLPRALPQE